MLRDELNDALKTAMKARDERTTQTLRMVLAGLKDKDIAARTKGVTTGIGDDEARTVMQNMVRQRRDSIAMYEKGGRADPASPEHRAVAQHQGGRGARRPRGQNRRRGRRAGARRITPARLLRARLAGGRLHLLV